MLHATDDGRYPAKATVYNIFTYILHLLQTKEYMKRGYFSLVSDVFCVITLDRPLYKSVGVACSTLQASRSHPLSVVRLERRHEMKLRSE